MQEKILGPLVWNEFLKLLKDDNFIMSLREQVIKIHAENDSAKVYAQLKAKLYGLNSQLDALAERVAILPKAVSPGPLFKQMEKIETNKKEIEERLLKTTEVDLDQRLVPMETFSKFSGIVKKSLSENPDMDMKKMILQKFVRRVEVGPDKVKIFWNVDKEFYLNEVSQAEACGSFRIENKFTHFGSNTLKSMVPCEGRSKCLLLKNNL